MISFYLIFFSKNIGYLEIMIKTVIRKNVGESVDECAGTAGTPPPSSSPSAFEQTEIIPAVHTK